MRVVIHSILKLKEALGGGDVEMDLPQGTTVAGLLDRMRERWGERLSPHLFDPASDLPLPHVRVMVNGQTIRFLDGMETVLKEDDEVLLLPLVAGGRA
jgi:molybdopterin synthase sulfur carrier subunit